jgi:hypothetical protein
MLYGLLALFSPELASSLTIYQSSTDCQVLGFRSPNHFSMDGSTGCGLVSAFGEEAVNAMMKGTYIITFLSCLSDELTFPNLGSPT